MTADLDALAAELRRVAAAGRECPILNALEVGCGALALASMGLPVAEGWHREPGEESGDG